MHGPAVFVRFRLFWRNARDSLWFLPACMVMLAVALAIGLLRIDTRLDYTGARVWWLFAGNADSARAVLSVVAGSLITVVAVAFSVTVIAIQQASTQYSPRILRSFTSNRGNQIVLGAYIATFVFALLVLRRVREASGDGRAFIPSISISAAVVFALTSFGLLVYFIHHVTRSLQVSALLAGIGSELRNELSHQFPKQLGASSREPRTLEAMLDELPDADHPHVCSIHCGSAGYLRVINTEAIARVAQRRRIQAVVLVAIGQYVQHRELLARVFSAEPLGDEVRDALADAFSTDVERSVEQDPLFAVQQIVDIALKALSPGINDPTTAAQCLDQLGDALALLLERELPGPERWLHGSRFLFRVPSLRDFFDASLRPIRRAGRSQLRVAELSVCLLGRLAQRDITGQRARELQHQLEETASTFAWDSCTQHEQRQLGQLFSEVRARLSAEASAEPAGA